MIVSRFPKDLCERGVQHLCVSMGCGICSFMLSADTASDIIDVLLS